MRPQAVWGRTRCARALCSGGGAASVWEAAGQAARKLPKEAGKRDIAQEAAGQAAGKLPKEAGKRDIARETAGQAGKRDIARETAGQAAGKLPKEAGSCWETLPKLKQTRSIKLPQEA